MDIDNSEKFNLVAPNYIPIHKIAKTEVDYTWDEWDPYKVIGQTDEVIYKKLLNISKEGILVFAIGCAEWVVYSLSDFIKGDSRPYVFLEQCWSFLLKKNGNLPPETKESEWKGPVLGAIDLSLMTILNVWNSEESKSSANDAAFLATLVLHVLSNNESKHLFNDWMNKVIDRLNSILPKGNNLDSVVIDRSILDINEADKLGNLKGSFAKIDEALQKHRLEVYRLLNQGAVETDFAKLSKEVFDGKPIPPEIETWFRWHNGQGGYSSLSPENNRTLLSVEQLIESWKFCCDPEAMGPWNKTWIPLLENGAGDYLVFESSKDERYGSLIGYWHDDRERKQEFTSIIEWADRLVKEIRGKDSTIV